MFDKSLWHIRAADGEVGVKKRCTGTEEHDRDMDRTGVLSPPGRPRVVQS
jgi:hypothetical protein